MKKIVSMVLALSLCAALFTACGNKKVTLKILDTEYASEDYAICIAKENTELLNKVNAALDELTADGTAKKIVDKYISGTANDLVFQANADGKDELHMATNAQFPPYEYYEGEKIVGIDAEMAAAIADKLDMKLVIDDMDFDAIITSVQQGKSDMGMAGMTVTEDRLKNINFSKSYATGIQSVIVPEGSKITSVDDLSADGAKYLIGTQKGTTGDTYAEDDFGAERVMKYASGNEAIQALVTGKVDCVIIDNEPAKIFVEQNDGLKILDTPYTVEDYAIAIAKENDELKDQFNAAIAELKADGTLDQLIAYYITKDESASPYTSPEGITYDGKLIMATNAAFPPYEYYESDQVVGLDVDIAKAICDKLGKELEVVDMDFDAIITAVQSGKADFAAAGMTVTEDRLQNVNFTDSYATGIQVIVVKK
mgnify:CR=1 FL=1